MIDDRRALCGIALMLLVLLLISQRHYHRANNRADKVMAMTQQALDACDKWKAAFVRMERIATNCLNQLEGVVR